MPRRRSTSTRVRRPDVSALMFMSSRTVIGTFAICGFVSGARVQHAGALRLRAMDAARADLGEEDLGLDDTGADIDDDWGLEDEEAEQEA